MVVSVNTAASMLLRHQAPSTTSMRSGSIGARAGATSRRPRPHGSEAYATPRFRRDGTLSFDDRCPSCGEMRVGYLICSGNGAFGTPQKQIVSAA